MQYAQMTLEQKDAELGKRIETCVAQAEAHEKAAERERQKALQTRRHVVILEQAREELQRTGNNG